MHIHFAGVGAGITPLAIIAKQAGLTVSASDSQTSEYTKQLENQKINVANGQSENELTKINSQKPIDWIVYSSALEKENSEHTIFLFAKKHKIKHTKRDEFLASFLKQKNLKLIAIAGTHGKSTTTAMVIWLFKQLEIPISYCVGAKLSFGNMGEYNKNSEYFVYECDEYDKNFLSFQPFISIISGIAYDHPDIFPTKKSYDNAFKQFIKQSNWTILWEKDAKTLALRPAPNIYQVADVPFGLSSINLTGEVNRQNARLSIQAVAEVVDAEFEHLIVTINSFPGLSRRFEQITTGIYSDYAHTPEKISGAIQIAQEVSKSNIVVVYEGLHNTRQHFIKKQLETLFEECKKVYVVPSYRAREDESLEDLTPQKLCNIIKKPEQKQPMKLDNKLKTAITSHVNDGDLVLCLSAGGGGSLDEWLRKEFRI